MERMKECSSASNSSYEFRSLQTTYNIMLFYLNQIAEMSWYRKLFAPLFFKEEVFIRDYNEIMDGIAVLKSGRQEK